MQVTFGVQGGAGGPGWNAEVKGTTVAGRLFRRYGLGGAAEAGEAGRKEIGRGEVLRNAVDGWVVAGGPLRTRASTHVAYGRGLPRV